MRSALIKDGFVVNLIEYEEGSDYNPGDEFSIVDLSGKNEVSIGWTWDGSSFKKPPTHSLIAYPSTVPADNSTPAEVVYQSTLDDAPLEVTFRVNGLDVTEPMVDGEARIEVTAAQPGPITISCNGLETQIEGVS